MTEFSMFPWETQTGTGDGTNSYNQDQTNDFFRYFDLQDPATEGVGIGVLNELEVTAPNPNLIEIDTGVGISYGRFFNDAVVQFAIVDDVAIMGYRIVMRSIWADNETRLVLISSGSAAIPPIGSQTVGTTWDISLATFTKAAGVAGAISVTDTRVYLKSLRMVDTKNITDDAVTTVKIADEAVTPSKILDRTRTFFMPTFLGWDGVLPFAGVPAYITPGVAYLSPFQVISLPTALDNYAIASGVVPHDIVGASLATLDVVINVGRAAGGTNIVLETTISAIGNCSGGGFASNTTGVATIAVPPVATATAVCVQTLTLTGTFGVGDEGGILNVWVKRHGTNVNDNHGFEVDILGFRLTYTADS